LLFGLTKKPSSSFVNPFLSVDPRALDGDVLKEQKTLLHAIEDDLNPRRTLEESEELVTHLLLGAILTASKGGQQNGCPVPECETIEFGSLLLHLVDLREIQCNVEFVTRSHIGINHLHLEEDVREEGIHASIELENRLAEVLIDLHLESCLQIVIL
jgi:hypothetical protein